MEEIEIGEYVRTKDGIIDKAIIEYNGKCNNSNCSEKHISCKYNYYNEKDIVNHSKQLIDLIEVGDIVNDYKVLAIKDSIYENSKRILIYKNEKERYERWIYIQEYNGRIQTQDDIVIILTKEQYKANCYKVGGEDEN